MTQFQAQEWRSQPAAAEHADWKERLYRVVRPIAAGNPFFTLRRLSHCVDPEIRLVRRCVSEALARPSHVVDDLPPFLGPLVSSDSALQVVWPGVAQRIPRGGQVAEGSVRADAVIPVIRTVARRRRDMIADAAWCPFMMVKSLITASNPLLGSYGAATSSPSRRKSNPSPILELSQ